MQNQKLPRRLEELNRELISEKRYAQVHARRGDERIRVVLERTTDEPRRHVSDQDFKATVLFEGRTIVASGVLPSHAFGRLAEMLGCVIDQPAELSKSNVVQFAEKIAA